ncbi:Ankyrin repeat-containing domain, partial [Lasallia pustulata]
MPFFVVERPKTNLYLWRNTVARSNLKNVSIKEEESSAGKDSGLRGSEHTVNDAKKSKRNDTIADAKLRVDSEMMTVPRLGVGVLHEPSKPPAAVVDIVFVHGLTGEPANTWLHTASGIYWPATLLSRDVPNSRILSFGYDADVVNFWNPTSQNRIGNHALNMLGGLTRLREKSDTENRKVIFVTHSLGGLVTQDCLCSSRSHPEKHLQQISSCTIGIVFLGTLHHGADLAAWAKFVSTIAKTIKHVNSDIVSVLKPGSEMLAKVQDGFHGLLRLRRNEESEIAVTCFFEELPLPLVGKVVEMESAILPGYASYGIHANHMDMTKFDNKDNAGYESVLGELRRWAKGLQPALGTAPTVQVKAQKGNPETRPQDRRDDKEAELLETLASDYKSDKESISVRVPCTCEWFFEDDRFLEWRDSTYSRLLWVSAGPGCGKSVLSRALIDERRVCKNPRDSTVCYFFFKDGQEQRTHGTDALSAMLHQLFENTGLITYALPSYRNYGKKLRDAFSELWGILVSFLDEGADINAQCGVYGNALEAASERGHDQVVRMLLDKGADVNAQGGVYGNALYAASSRGQDQVVRMLLDKGADANAQGGMYGNALQAASKEGHDQVVQMLLDKGANVNAQGG